MAVTLKIAVDPADVTRGFNAALGVAKRFNTQLAAESKRAGDAQIRSLNEVQSAVTRGLAKRTSLEQKWVQAKKDANTEIEKIEKSAADASVEAEKKALQEKAKLLRQRVTMVERAVREEISAQQRAVRSGAIRQGVGGILNAGFSGAVGGFHQLRGQMQNQRQQNADVETDLNTTLMQAIPQGSNRGEIARYRARIQQFARDNNMLVENIIPAISDAQTRYNALGGATSDARSAALENTLRNVQFASVIDPNNVGGLTSFGALLQQQGITGDLQQSMLRRVAGIGFAGSAESDEVLKSAMPAMLRDLSTALARNPGNREQVITDQLTDFVANIQAVVASGNAIGVSAGRMTTLQNALGNANTQNRLGAALSRRHMTDEQRAEFNRSFTRNRSTGAYTMNEALATDPAAAAAFFGHQFGNDQTALSNFLGVHGGGGRRQLLRSNEISLLTSYFAQGQDSHGVNRPQYELVADLKSRTITDAQYEEMRALRASEDRNNLNRNQNNERTNITEAHGGWLGSISDAMDEFRSNHPVLAAFGQNAGGVGALTGLKSLFGAGEAGTGLAGGAANIGRFLLGRVALPVASGLLAYQGWNQMSAIGNTMTDTTQSERWGTAFDMGASDRLHDRMIATQRARVDAVDESIGRDQSARFAAITGNNVNAPDPMMSRILYDAVVRGMRDAAPYMNITTSPTDIAHAQARAAGESSFNPDGSRNGYKY